MFRWMTAALAGAAMMSGCAAAADAGARAPNIVFIHVDDLGYHDLGITGSKIYQTPAIDRLAGQSAAFGKAYSNYPRCVPSRYALMTATYPVEESKGNLGKIAPASNFVRVLNDAGYETFFVGKWHLGAGASSPTGFGFDRSFAAGETGGAGSHFYPFNVGRESEEGEKSPMPDVEEAGKTGDYLADLLTDKTVDFIKERAAADAPFFAMLSFYAVHTPLEAKPADRARNQAEIDAFDFGDQPAYVAEGPGDRKMRQDNADYAGMIENLDENVGRVIAALEELGLRDDTILVFSSDHGGLSNRGRNNRIIATTNEPLRAGKGWLYEGGVRTPLFVSWPGKIAPKFETKSIIVGMDVFPTLLDLALDKELKNVDGRSFEKVIAGKEAWSDRTVFWHSSKARPSQTGDSPSSSVRKGDYKLIHFFSTGKTELYNLAADPGEKQDLSKKQPDRAAAMLAELDAWKAQRGIATVAKAKEKKKRAR